MLGFSANPPKEVHNLHTQNLWTTLEGCMTDSSRLSLWGLVVLSLGLTTACRNETPAFTEQDMAAIAVSVLEDGYENEDRENVFSIDDEMSSENTEDNLDGIDNEEPSRKGQGRPDDEAAHPNRKNADQETDDASDAASSGKSSSSAYGINSDDSKAIAKACSKHFKGMGAKIVVLSAGDSVQSLSLSSQTVLALRLTGHQPSLKLALAAGQALAGLCIVMRGHEPTLQLNNGATVKKMVYLAAGDQSMGDIQFSNGLEESYIELAGHQAELSLRGVDASVCDSARLRNHSNRIHCIP
jgi:hypothetical protein